MKLLFQFLCILLTTNCYILNYRGNIYIKNIMIKLLKFMNPKTLKKRISNVYFFLLEQIL